MITPGQDRLRILHAPPFYHPAWGGAENHVRALSERLAARGHAVSVLTQRRGSFLAQGTDRALRRRDRVASLPVRRVDLHGRRAALVERCLRVPGVWGAITRLGGPFAARLLAHEAWSAAAYAAAARSRADIVLVSNLGFGEWAHPVCLGARRGGAALVGLPLLHTEESWPHTRFVAHLLRQCDALMVNTAFEGEFVAAVGVPGATHVVGTGVEPRDFEGRDGRAFRAQHGLGHAPVVGFVGRLERLKGLVLLLEAMRIVWRARPQARLVVAGRPHAPGTPKAEEVRVALAGLTPDERARLVLLEHAPAAAMPSLFDALDVFAMPSVVESFGTVYLESWMCRRPVVGARIGAVACVIDDGRDGRLVDPVDPRETAAAVSGLLDDPELRARMGEAGRAKTLARFTWDRLADQVEAIYLDLAGRREHAHSAGGEPRRRTVS